MSGGSGVPSSERLKSVLSSLPVPPTSLKKVPETQQQQEQQLYRPWDRASLLKRAATFKAHLWFGKPSVVSAMECARHGWICIEPDLLECECCGARLAFEAPKHYSQQRIQEIAKRFAERLDSSHKGSCPWKGGACARELGRFPPLSQQALREGFASRLERLRQTVSYVPALEDPKLTQISDEVLRANVVKVLTDKKAVSGVTRNGDAAPNTSAYEQAVRLLALCGWEIDSRPYDIEELTKPVETLKAAVTESISPKDKFQRLKFVASSKGDTSLSSHGGNQQLTKSLEVRQQAFVLRCPYCDAVAALWYFTPGAYYDGRVLAKPISGDAGPLASPASASRGTSGTSQPSPKTIIPTSMIDLGGTIAGGASPVGNNGSPLSGPFGSKQSPIASARSFGLAGCFGAFGSFRTSPSPLSGKAQVRDSPLVGSSLSRVFDQAADHSQSTSATVLGKRSNDVDLSNAQKKQNTNSVEPQAAAAIGIPTSVEEVLIHMLNLVGNDGINARTFNPIKYHRSSCPWVSSVINSNIGLDKTKTDTASCGWERTLTALMADDNGDSKRKSALEFSRGIPGSEAERSQQKSKASSRSQARQFVESFLGKK